MTRNRPNRCRQHRSCRGTRLRRLRGPSHHWQIARPSQRIPVYVIRRSQGCPRQFEASRRSRREHVLSRPQVTVSAVAEGLEVSPV